jgi:F-type H+-transporting ATPase subunit epsilon
MFKLTIVTAEKTTYEGDVQMLIVPTMLGEIGILTNHHPIITKLAPGAMRVVKPDNSEERVFVGGGYLEVMNNKAIILADVIENIDAIQIEEASAARQRAQEMVKNAKDDVERAKLEEELHLQMIRERFASIGKFARRDGKESMPFENEQ